MGLLDQILGGALGGQATQSQSGGLGGLGDILSGLAGGNRQQAGGSSGLMMALLPVLLGMLANRGGNSAGAGLGGGLDGLLRQFQAAGLGQQADSWVGTGANMPVSAEDLSRVFGRERMAQIAAQAGVGEDEASNGLASLLPEFVNQLTPRGELPAESEADDALASLQRSLGI